MQCAPALPGVTVGRARERGAAHRPERSPIFGPGCSGTSFSSLLAWWPPTIT